MTRHTAFSLLLTCANEQHVVGPLHALDLVHGNLRVAHAALQQQGGAADHAVHQKVVLDKVEHFVGHVQGRLDPHLPGVVRHALQWEGKRHDGLLHDNKSLQYALTELEIFSKDA